MSLTTTQELELQAISGAAQRRNQPRFLLFLAVILLLVSVFYAYSGLNASKKAHQFAARKAAVAVQIDGKIAQYNTLNQGGPEGGLETRFPVNSRIRSTLESSAEIFGLETPTVTQRPERAGLDYPLRRQIVTAQLSDAPLEPTLKWINSATKNIDGLYVAGVEFSPTPRGWQIEVRFARWEVVPK